MRFPQQSENFSEENYSQLVDAINALSSTIDLDNNIDGQIITGIKISMNKTVNIPHKLNRVPIYRIILRQLGAALISDGEWNDSSIQLSNQSGHDTILTIMIL